MPHNKTAISVNTLKSNIILLSQRIHLKWKCIKHNIVCSIWNKIRKWPNKPMKIKCFIYIYIHIYINNIRKQNYQNLGKTWKPNLTGNTWNIKSGLTPQDGSYLSFLYHTFRILICSLNNYTIYLWNVTVQIAMVVVILSLYFNKFNQDYLQNCVNACMNFHNGMRKSAHIIINVITTVMRRIERFDKIRFQILINFACKLRCVLWYEDMDSSDCLAWCFLW